MLEKKKITELELFHNEEISFNVLNYSEITKNFQSNPDDYILKMDIYEKATNLIYFYENDRIHVFLKEYSKDVSKIII